MAEGGVYEDPDLQTNIYEDPDLQVNIYEDPDLQTELEDCANLFQNEPLSNAKNIYDEFTNVTLNIAVTGESGAGKSTFVNAIRGLTDEDDGAAETGVTETTKEAIRYSHPTMSNVYIWDLPGIGTPNFKAKKYLKQVHFDSYDFFIIIGSVRFKDYDVMLAKEINKLKRQFYFVRSKIDVDVHNETSKKKRTEQEVLSQIRQSCEENLKSLGNPRVFLISNNELGKYDFDDLVDSLASNLSMHKRSALIRSFPVCSQRMIKRKSVALKVAAAATALASCATVLIPMPAAHTLCEMGLMLGFLKGSISCFGLDKKSLKRLSEKINKSEFELRSMMKSCFVEGVDPQMVYDIMESGAKYPRAVQYCISQVPGLGVLAVPFEFSLTLYLLIFGVTAMAKDAQTLYIDTMEHPPTLP